MELMVAPLIPERFSDFAALARQMGPNRSCWCLYWRQGEVRLPGTARKRAERLVRESPHPTGVIAYEGETPVGWAALSPRCEYPRLNRGRDTAPVEGHDTAWVIPCLFVVASHRGRGVATALIRHAVELARTLGAAEIEGVPGDPGTKSRSQPASYTGTLSMFARAGFREVARRTPKGRVVMRREL